jgi:uncharacterized protein YgiM (DUF1202 family)
MIRLGLLMLATLLGLFLALQTFGTGDLRSQHNPRPVKAVSAAQDAGRDPLVGTSEVPPAEPIVRAEAQTPEKKIEYPGPELEPSPEYAGSTPAAPAVELGEEGEVMYVTASSVNIRSGPGTQNSVVDSLGRGTAVEAVGAPDGDWVRIRTAQDRLGYVSGQFLSSTAP